MKITPGRVDNQAGPWCCRVGGKGCQCCHTECHSVCPYITDPVGKASPESCSGWCQRHLLVLCCSTLSAQGPGWFDHLRMHRGEQWAVLVLNASCSSVRASGWILGRALCTGDGPGCHSLCLPRKMSTSYIFLFGFLSLGSVCSVRPLHFSFPRANLVCQQHCSAGYLLKVLLEIPK